MRKTPSRHERPRKKTRNLLRIMGVPAVSALFATSPKRVEKLFFDSKNKILAGAFCSKMAAAHKLYRLVEPDEMERIAGTALHGGIVALAEARPIPAFSPVEAAQWAKENKTLLILDGVGNPHNLGAIARTAAFLGIPRIVLSDHPEQALPSDSTYRVAEGGMEYISFYRATRLAETLEKLRQSHRVIGTAAEGGKALGKLKKSDRPFALILGNEENGIPPETLKLCDDIVTIPGSGAVQSLNVSASAAILLYALVAV
jgi:TrmH RNA methyltransferase